MDIIIYHKPRGCKGVWQKIEQGNAIRVTRGKGKWLKLEIRCLFELKAKDIDVYLVDVTKGDDEIKLFHSPEEGFNIVTTSTSQSSNGLFLVI